MTDIVDLAQDVTERATEEALKNVTRYTGESATHCRDCDVEIPQERREAVKGCIRCVDCASITTG